MRGVRTFFRVHDGVDEHPKIAPLSDAAFRLLFETWAFCSRNRNDGRLADGVWRKRGRPKPRRELEAAGLVERHDGYVQVHDYLDWQRSATEIDEYVDKKRRASAKGTHVRYHVGEGRPDPSCPLCADDDRPSGESRPPSRNGSHPDPDEASHSGSQVASQVASRPASQNGAQRQRQRQIPELTYGGDGAEPNAGATPPPPAYPDHCSEHAHIAVPPACGRCKETRLARRAAARAAPRLQLVPAADSVFDRPPWCGECNEFTRLLTRDVDGRDVASHCPACHPLARQETA